VLFEASESSQAKHSLVALERISAESGAVSSTIRGMTTREKVHKLVDELPESQLEPVAEFIESQDEDPMITAFRDAPEDDEPWTDEDEAAAAEGRADIAAGRTVSHEEMLRKYG
jgi:predicted transcriptional regulator